MCGMPRWRPFSGNLGVLFMTLLSAASRGAPSLSPPGDAILLFAGNDLSQWVDNRNRPAPWIVENGYLEVAPKTPSLHTRQRFGDCQLHVEWAERTDVQGKGQKRGNSGVILMGRYEIQVLDCYHNDTYADGYAGAVYGQEPPWVNCCRPPGAWQTYDIVFRRPHFDAAGKLAKPAFVTVFHNGVVIHHNTVLFGPASFRKRQHYRPHPDRLPLTLQNHGDRVRYRNIWIRPLPEGSDRRDPEQALKRYEAELAAWPWKVNDRNRPRPPVVVPGVGGSPPSDATVLFPDRSLIARRGAARTDEKLFSVTGVLETREAFAGCQVHLEWKASAAGKKASAGVVFPGGAEVQLEAPVGGFRGGSGPLARVSPAGDGWYTCDLAFSPGVPASRGLPARNGRLTALLNGVLVQDAQLGDAFQAGEKAPLRLHDEQGLFQWRNLWVRSLVPPP